MSSSAITIELSDRVLRGTPTAHCLVRTIANSLHAQRRIVLDFTSVEWVDPQFAEQAFGPLAAIFGRSRLLASLCVTGADDVVVRAIAEAICRNSPRPERSRTQEPPAEA